MRLTTFSQVSFSVDLNKLDQFVVFNSLKLSKDHFKALSNRKKKRETKKVILKILNLVNLLYRCLNLFYLILYFLINTFNNWPEKVEPFKSFAFFAIELFTKIVVKIYIINWTLSVEILRSCLKIIYLKCFFIQFESRTLIKYSIQSSFR